MEHKTPRVLSIAPRWLHTLEQTRGRAAGGPPACLGSSFVKLDVLLTVAVTVQSESGFVFTVLLLAMNKIHKFKKNLYMWHVGYWRC